MTSVYGIYISFLTQNRKMIISFILNSILKFNFYST